jgi:hypothetical protein
MPALSEVTAMLRLPKSEPLKVLLVCMLAVTFGVAALYFFIERQWGEMPPPGGPCLAAALQMNASSLEGCRYATSAYVADAIYGRTWNRASWMTVPERLYWLDNLLVDSYSALLLVIAVFGYQRRTGYRTVRVAPWRWALGVAATLIVVGGIVDHAENFWGLAKISDGARQLIPQPFSEPEVLAVSKLSVTKFWFLFVNVAFALWWLYVARGETKLASSLVQQYKAEHSDAKRRQQLFGLRAGATESCQTYWAEIAKRQWDVRAPLAPADDGLAYHWHGCIFFAFIHGHLANDNKGGRYYFTEVAVLNFVAATLAPPRAPFGIREARRFLALLAHEGYLDPHGFRYEVIEDQHPA